MQRKFEPFHVQTQLAAGPNGTYLLNYRCPNKSTKIYTGFGARDRAAADLQFLVGHGFAVFTLNPPPQ